MKKIKVHKNTKNTSLHMRKICHVTDVKRNIFFYADFKPDFFP